MLGAAIGGTIYLLLIKESDFSNTTKWIFVVLLMLLGQYVSTYIYDRFHNK
ncbi:MAG: hypothetical protein Q4A09_08095 [Capnocytophaga felis]|nr:hypothetical protein [Capnocytophaga felis]